MAYIKYKELTKYFNFNEELNIEELDGSKYDYIKQFLAPKEEVYAIYKTRRDKAVFTNDRMILFDVLYFFGLTKKIHMIPYKSISTSAILFNKKSAAILLSMNSGYQVRLNFVSLKPKDKTRLRQLYSHIMNQNRK